MTENPTALPVESAAITDRGLSEKRPLNEDSMLNDTEHAIFAVADGVGGAQAGEVASKTAVEVLEEAFRHQKPGEDVEDLMEIAIQRANNSIYRMSREQPALAMMATTIVALHVDGSTATVGHVGDSRLYSFSPGGELRRETEDHSLVEEEVRAGRLTPEQAANHPGRNVISRALGAEASVEVDMRTFDVEDGTIFLLCSDGITRHIPDGELSSILRDAPTLDRACEEMKRLCYERGAEDNLTAVLVRVGGEGARAAGASDEEVTLVRERESFRSVSASADSPATHHLRRPFNGAGSDDSGATAASAAAATHDARTSNGPDDSSKDARGRRGSGGGAFKTLGAMLLVLACVGLAFYVGIVFERKGGGRMLESRTGAKILPGSTAEPTPATVATPAAPAESAEARFERLRRAVDRSPATEAARMSAEANNLPLESNDPEFLYLYGRAMLLTDRHADAIAAFDRALLKVEENMTPENGELKIDARLAKVSAHLRAGDDAAAREAARALEDVIRPQAGAENANAAPTP